MGHQQLSGLRLLVAEDEYFLADDARAVLAGAGAEVLGPVATVAEARELIATGTAVDAVLLDVNLRGEMTFDIADSLQAGGVPFAFVTGYDRAGLPERFAGVARLEKPVDAGQLVTLFETLSAARGAGGAA